MNRDFTAADRKELRKKWRVEITPAGEYQPCILNEGDFGEKTPLDNLIELDMLRKMFYPELKRDLRMDKSIVSFRHF
jgi:hypothetical protein